MMTPIQLMPIIHPDYPIMHLERQGGQLSGTFYVNNFDCILLYTKQPTMTKPTYIHSQNKFILKKLFSNVLFSQTLFLSTLK